MTEILDQGRSLAHSGRYAPRNADQRPPDPAPDAPPPAEVPRLWPATDLHPAQPPQWLASGRLPRAAISLLIGDEGIGKSLMWVWLTSAITTGTALPGFGIPVRDPADVIVVITEDDWATTVRPRLEVAGADLTRVKVMCIEPDGSGSPTFPLHLPILSQADPAALIVVDAWLDTLPAGLQVRDPQQARQALHPWKDLATGSGAAVLLVCHTNRVSSPNARDKYGATGVLRQKARLTLFAQLDRDDRLTVGPEKSNGSAPVPATSFTITPVQAFAPTIDSDGTVPRLDYAGQSEMTARQHLAATAIAAGEADSGDIDEWLARLLADGPMTANEVFRAADAAGYSRDKAKRAKKRIGVDATKSGSGPWLWSLPDKSAHPDPSLSTHSLTSLHSLQVREGAEGAATEQACKRTRENDTGSARALPVRCGCGTALTSPESVTAGRCLECRTDGGCSA
ncbi:AAA family ATPase [Mycobacterium sp. M1]|uniref:AAA family ATPase n=1 Tax=Mycolicibacter acidiphilus TaxID=2835306 RepID=A0ABS5RIY6_9MYCO|nr:AAA family ATPase [Mycolicibacter acidiphilus]MBS9533543.1 AAA family ATPase [Mycolicibacter acidiphilus]